MIRDLPRKARYIVLLDWRSKNEPEEHPEDDSPPSEMRRQIEDRYEMRVWSDKQLELQAMMVNRLDDLIRFVPNWKKTPDEPDRVGPRSWWTEEQRKRHRKLLEQPASPQEKKPASVLEAMMAMGYQPGVNDG